MGRPGVIRCKSGPRLLSSPKRSSRGKSIQKKDIPIFTEEDLDRLLEETSLQMKRNGERGPHLGEDDPTNDSESDTSNDNTNSNSNTLNNQLTLRLSQIRKLKEEGNDSTDSDGKKNNDSDEFDSYRDNRDREDNSKIIEKNSPEEREEEEKDEAQQGNDLV